MTGAAITIGKFDSVHKGHQQLLEDIIRVSKENGYESICFKLDFGEPGILTGPECESLMREMGIDKILFERFTPEFAGMGHEEFVKEILVDRLGAKYIAVGKDFRYGKDRIGTAELLKEAGRKYGFEVNIIDKLVMEGETVSSTRVRGALEVGDMKEADKLMGHPYSLTGDVMAGKQLGRTLGYPTINLGYDEKKLLPKYGVYSSRIIVYNDMSCDEKSSSDVQTFSGITNIGVRPSVDDGDTVTVETFIYDFDDDIYGCKVEIILENYLRQEQKFDSLEALTAQITQDIKAAKG